MATKVTLGTSLICRLLEIQARDGLSNDEMARRLRIHPVSWSLIKNSPAPASMLMRERIIQAFEELIWPTISVIREDRPKEPEETEGSN